MSPRKRIRDKHLPPRVYRKHGAYWHVKDGKWTRLGSSLHEALRQYAGLYDSPKGGMGDLISKVLTHLEPKLADNTRAQYRKAGKKLSAMLAEFTPADVTPRDVAQIKVAYASKPNMGNRLLSLLRTVFQYAVEWQLVDSNPCIGIRRHDEKKRTRLLTWDEVAAIRAKADPRLQCIIDLLIATGQRPIDVLKVKRADLGTDGIYFRQQKTGARVVVRWTPDLEAAVERAKKLHGGAVGLTLFRSRRGRTPAYKTVYIQWRAACEAAGIDDADLRDLRALAATEAKRQGLNPTALLGHKSAQMTERYLRDKEIPMVDGPRIRQSLDK